MEEEYPTTIQQSKMEDHRKDEPAPLMGNVIMMKTADETPESLDSWVPLNPQLSQTKPLVFAPTQKAQGFWSTQVSSEPADLFRALLPKKIVLGLCQHLNATLRRTLQSVDERSLKKKLYKPEQLYEWAGVKVLMGYCRMPDPEDYFNLALPFRNRIGDLIKEGRFKAVESWTQFSDECVLAPLRGGGATKAEHRERDASAVIPHITKKVNKL